MSAQQKLPQFIHDQPSMGLPFEKELLVGLSAGNAGTDTGIARTYRSRTWPWTTTKSPRLSIANHPNTAHYVADV